MIFLDDVDGGGSDSEPSCDHGQALSMGQDTLIVERAAAIFRALGDSSRLLTIQRLAKGEACVTELAGERGESLSTVSQRLRLMRSERLVQKRREGKHVYYSLADDHILEIIKSAFEHANEEL